MNVSNIIDMSWLKNPVYKDHIRSVLYIWQAHGEWKCSCGCFEWKSVSKWKTDGHDRMFTGRLSGGERFRRHCAQFLHRRYLCGIPLFLRHSARKKSCMSSVLDFPIRSFDIEILKAETVTEESEVGGAWGSHGVSIDNGTCAGK